ncbi:MAG: PucR family transcriptional regulator [Dorea sp.]|jgi:purine catabolism regulator|nr:PucR family transcriptional regulator [Dorea sp.]
MKMLTVSDVLKSDVFRDISVRAGTKGLSNTVTSITIAEDTDLLQWLNGNEILLTSLSDASLGHFSYREYVCRLAEKQISALFIKPLSLLSEIPQEILESADPYGIPIIELPRNVRFIDIITSVMALIHKNKNQYYIEIQNNLSVLLASGAKEEDVLNYLADYIPACISLYDDERILISRSQSDAFDSKRAVADRIKLPIMCMGEVNGYLEAVTNQVLDENLEMLLKTAANLLAVLYLKKYYVAEIEQKYISNFMADLFEGNLEAKQIEEKAAGYGWKTDDLCCIVSVELGSKRRPDKIPEALIEIARFIPKEHYYFYIKEPCMHIMYRTHEPLSPSALYGSMNKLLSELNTFINDKYRVFSFHAGISTITNTLSKIPEKISESYDALQFGHAFGSHIVKYEEMGLLRILATHSNIENFEQIIPPAVRKLAEHDKANNTEYLETLDILLGNNLNLSKTAKQLFIHYKTMLHRMNRICEIAEISLDNRQTRLDVELGVKLYMMLPK